MSPGPYSKHYIFFVLTNGPNKLECLFLASLICLMLYNTLAYFLHLLWRNWSFVNKAAGSAHNNAFSLYLTNRPNRLECLFLVDLSILVLCNVLAYCAHL